MNNRRLNKTCLIRVPDRDVIMTTTERRKENL